MSRTIETHSINLSPRYAPNWGVWEIAREIISNAIDADPDGFKVSSDGQDVLHVYTSTTPELSEMFVIGEGTKAPGGSTIGQFGEGFKLAALTITRMRGASMLVSLPDCYVTFEFKPSMGVEVLHAVIEPREGGEKGMTVTLTAPGIAHAYKDRILEDRKAGPLPKSGSNMTVYLKGIFVNTFEAKSAYDWNLSDLEINRDRSFVEVSNIESSVRRWLNGNITPEIARRLVQSPKCWESDACLQYASGTDAHLALAFKEEYGADALCAGALDTDASRAEQLGYRVIRVGGGLLRRLASIKKPADVLNVSSQLEYVDASKYQSKINRLRELDRLVNAPNFTVRVFANRQDNLMGIALREDNLIALNERIFNLSHEEQAGTYLHEIAHLISGATDKTFEFESALTRMLGRLAAKFRRRLHRPHERDRLEGTVSISVASAMTGIQVPTLKFWEQEFSEHLKPSRTVGGQRRYSPEDIHVVFTIKRLLRDELMSLKGAARQLDQMFKEVSA